MSGEKLGIKFLYHYIGAGVLFMTVIFLLMYLGNVKIPPENKDIFVAFQDKSSGQWYMYDHDKILGTALDLGKLEGTVSWEKAGSWSWSSSPEWLQSILSSWAV